MARRMSHSFIHNVKLSKGESEMSDINLGASSTNNEGVQQVDTGPVIKMVDTPEGECELLKSRIAELEGRLSTAVMFRDYLQYQPYIDNPPVQDKEQLYQRACSNDGVTITSWHNIWLGNVKANCAEWDVASNTAMEDYARFAYKPGIVAGSGPSLKRNAHLLKDRGEMALVSCLHNFGFLEDLGAGADYYVNLDAGDITIPEMSEGGKHDAEHYWELTRDRTLVTSITANPVLHRKWKGRILWYNAIAASQEYVDAMQKITPMNLVYSVGGNTLGACLYHAKAILGCCPIIYVGADFSFGYDKQFHSWGSPYQFSGVMPATDVWGNRVYTYPSYYNFKAWFDYVACGGKGNQPGMYINCTEGGILGAYAEGNIRQIQQMPLEHVMWMYNVHRRMGAMRDNKAYQYLF
jgi:hypothetical protein